MNLSASDTGCDAKGIVVRHGGRDRGGQGGHGPSNNLVGGAIMYLAPQYLLKKSSTSGFRNIS